MSTIKGTSRANRGSPGPDTGPTLPPSGPLGSTFESFPALGSLRRLIFIQCGGTDFLEKFTAEIFGLGASGV